MEEVKHMNQLVDQAKTMVVRDNQLQEKQEIFERRVQQEKNLDMMMENDRLRRMEAENRQAEEKRRKFIEGKQMILEQIKENDFKRSL